jgi:predicted aconitase with swiveling domain
VVTTETRNMVVAIANKRPGTIAEYLLEAAILAIREGLTPSAVTAKIADRLIAAAAATPGMPVDESVV